MIYAPSEDFRSACAYIQSLMRIFAVHIKKHAVLRFPVSALERLWPDSAGTQTDLILVGRTCHFVVFSCSVSVSIAYQPTSFFSGSSKYCLRSTSVSPGLGVTRIGSLGQFRHPSFKAWGGAGRHVNNKLFQAKQAHRSRSMTKPTKWPVRPAKT